MLRFHQQQRRAWARRTTSRTASTSRLRFSLRTATACFRAGSRREIGRRAGQRGVVLATPCTATCLCLVPQNGQALFHNHSCSRTSVGSERGFPSNWFTHVSIFDVHRSLSIVWCKARVASCWSKAQSGFLDGRRAGCGFLVMISCICYLLLVHRPDSALHRSSVRCYCHQIALSPLSVHSAISCIVPLFCLSCGKLCCNGSAMHGSNSCLLGPNSENTLKPHAAAYPWLSLLWYHIVQSHGLAPDDGDFPHCSHNHGPLVSLRFLQENVLYTRW